MADGPQRPTLTGRFAAAVVLIDPLPVAAIEYAPPPRLIFKIPIEGGCKVDAEAFNWLVPELSGDLGGVDCITAVMPRTIGDIRFEICCRFAVSGRCIWKSLLQLRILVELLIDRRAQGVDHFQIGKLRTAPNIIAFADPPALENEFDAAAVIVNEEPVAHLAAVTVNRQWAAMQGVEQEQRDQFFWKLIRTPVIVSWVPATRFLRMKHSSLKTSLARCCRAMLSFATPETGNPK